MVMNEIAIHSLFSFCNHGGGGEEVNVPPVGKNGSVTRLVTGFKASDRLATRFFQFRSHLNKKISRDVHPWFFLQTKRFLSWFVKRNAAV